MKNQIVVVTGAAHPKGIGHAIAMRFAAQESSVFVLDLEKSESDQVTSIVCDVTDRSSVDSAISRVLEIRGEISVLINKTYLRCTMISPCFRHSPSGPTNKALQSSDSL